MLDLQFCNPISIPRISTHVILSMPCHSRAIDLGIGQEPLVVSWNGDHARVNRILELEFADLGR